MIGNVVKCMAHIVRPISLHLKQWIKLDSEYLWFPLTGTGTIQFIHIEQCTK